MKIRNNKYHWSVQRPMAMDLYELYLTVELEPGRLARLTDPLLTEITEEQSYEMPTPILRCSELALQTLINELWQAGFRPSKGISSTGELEATKEHLKDMRTLAFDIIGVEKP